MQALEAGQNIGQERDYNDLRFYLDHEFPLIALKPKTKVPLEPWRETEWRKRPYEFYRNKNWGVKLGTEIFGGFLCVIDIDARNGGLTSLTKLTQAFGDFTKTMRVETSDRGCHLYFVSKKPFRKFKPADYPGVDILSEGCYVVGAGSIHPSGHVYRFEIADEPSDLPDFVLELSRVETVNGATYLDTEADQLLKASVPEGERDNWLVSQAGKLRFMGMEDDEILACLVALNRRCNPPKAMSDLERIAVSIGNKPTKESLERKAIVEISEKQEEPEVKESDIVRDLCALMPKAPGLIGEISKEILANAKRPYPHFAMASAFGIVAGVAQGGNQVPNLEIPKKGDGSVSLYQWITSPPGSGKNAYLSAVENYLDAIDNRLVSSKSGSSYGLRSSLYCFNAITSCIDEMQDEIAYLSRNPGSPMAQVITDMKELYNAKNELKAVATKGARFPTIYMPRLSIMGVGTTAGFKDLLSSTLVGGGFISRFLHWPEMLVPDFQPGGSDNFTPNEFHVKQLRSIFKGGLTEVGLSQDKDKAFDDLCKINEKGQKPPPHRPQTLPDNIIAIEPKAAVALIDFRTQSDITYRRYCYDGLADSEISPASIISRIPQIAHKLASLCAIARLEDNRISLQDAEFAISVARLLGDSLAGLIQGNASKSDLDRAVNRIRNCLEKQSEPINRKAILRSAHVLKHDFKYAMAELLARGEVSGFKDGVLIPEADAEKMGHGLKYLLTSKIKSIQL